MLPDNTRVHRFLAFSSTSFSLYSCRIFLQRSFSASTVLHLKSVYQSLKSGNCIFACWKIARRISRSMVGIFYFLLLLSLEFPVTFLAASSSLETSLVSRFRQRSRPRVASSTSRFLRQMSLSITSNSGTPRTFCHCRREDRFQVRVR